MWEINVTALVEFALKLKILLSEETDLEGDAQTGDNFQENLKDIDHSRFRASGLTEWFGEYKNDETETRGPVTVTRSQPS